MFKDKMTKVPIFVKERKFNLKIFFVSLEGRNNLSREKGELYLKH